VNYLLERRAMAELRVAIHLMGLGFHVARMLSPNAPTDLYAAKGRRILRVQVKSTLSLNQLKNLRNGGNDLLAVLVDGELHYRALDRRVQALVPGAILARRPKRQPTRHKNRRTRASAIAKKDA
jgi:hypothetical protein